jgi:COP9 signalosome complex subunit 6
VSLIKSYLLSLSEADFRSDSPKDETSPTQLSHPILRNINSLLSHLAILSPSEQSTFATELISQNNDVLLVSLLGQLGENIKAMREMGRRSEIVQGGRQVANARKDPSVMMRSFNEELYGQAGRGAPRHPMSGDYGQF